SRAPPAAIADQGAGRAARGERRRRRGAVDAMSLARALLEHFVTPPGDHSCAAHGDFVPHDEGPERACAVPAPRTPPGVAVLASAADAQPLGAALGLALAGARRAPLPVVSVWAPTP